MKKAIIIFSFMSFYIFGILGFNSELPLQAEEISHDKLDERKPITLSKKPGDFDNINFKKEVVKTVNVEATAYTAFCEGCSGTTRTGIDLRANPNQKVIAVDPEIIPLGSKVNVPGYGEAIAGDIGGDIKGNRIDLFMEENKDAMNYGRQQIKVEILAS